jgi:hypothetical protein
MEPEVRYFLLCDEARADPNNLLRIDVLGLLTHIRSTARPAFPLVRPEFCVLTILTGCRGTAEMSLRIVIERTGKVVWRSQSRSVQFAGAPNEATGFTFRVRNCVFPTSGLYWVELLYSGAVLARQPLTLTE